MKVFREDRVLIARSSLSQETCTALEGFSGAEVIGCRGLEGWCWRRDHWRGGNAGQQPGCRSRRGGCRSRTRGLARVAVVLARLEARGRALVVLGEVHMFSKNETKAGGAPFTHDFAV